MKARKDDLMRRFLLDVTRDGAIFVRERGTGPCPHGGMPCFSTGTRAEAEALRVRFCRRARDGSGVYRLTEFGGTLDALGTITNLFRAAYARTRAASVR